jgi:uncharacterized repeat protein (TIGR01451 family)
VKRLTPINFGPATVILVILSLILVGFRPDPASQGPQETASLPGSQVILRLEDRLSTFHVPPPAQTGVGIQSANFIINWNQNCSPPAYASSATLKPWPAEAQAAFGYAVNIWAYLLHASQPIEVDACWWSSLGTGVLGSAGAAGFYGNFSGAPVTNTWYPVALANSLAGTDLNGDNPEIRANFSSNFSWYFGTDGNPGFQVDFASVVLHELGHGLGFLGSMLVDDGNALTGVECNGNSGYGCWGFSSGYPFIYDRFAENNSGISLLYTATYPNPSVALGNVLTGQNVYFDGPNAKVKNGGTPVKLYAPNPWKPGSSYSHLDDATYNGTPNALMTYQIASGEALHDPGPVTLAMFKDMGWRVVEDPDLKITQQLLGSDHEPGDPVTIILTIENIGQATATDVVVSNLLSSDIESPGWSTSFSSVVEKGGSPYTWDLPDLAPQDSGTITITGTLDSALPEEFAIVNTATVSASNAEVSTTNNTSVAIIGGLKNYLPLVSKGF